MIIKIFKATIFYPALAIMLLVALIAYLPLLVVFLECLAKLSLQPMVVLWHDVSPYLDWGKAAFIYFIVLMSTLSALRG